MASIMELTDDSSDPNLDPLCPTLFESPQIAPFEKVYSNQVYVVLKVQKS